MRTVGILFVALILACCQKYLVQSAVQGQNSAPDFSGSWILDETPAKSDRRSRSARVITALEIEHREPELRMQQTIKENAVDRTQEVLYFTDNRGEVNMLPPLARGAPNENIQSHTKWDKDRLVIRYSLVWRIAGDTMYFDVEETWQLANNGNSLVQTKKFGNPQSAFHESLVLPEVMEKMTSVYTRKPLKANP